MIRYLIIDDEHIAHKIIMEYCEMLPNMDLQKNCYSALEAFQYIEASGNYSKVITLDETIIVREKISDVLASLNSDNFIQVHKSFAVSKNHIYSIEGNRIILGDNSIPIGKIYKNNIVQWLN